MSRIALVTGSAKRLGRSIALKLASHGYALVLHYRSSAQEAEETRELCLAAGAPHVQLVKADLAVHSERQSLMPHVLDLCGGLDLLVNSASMFEYDTVATASSLSLGDHLQTNFLAPIELSTCWFQEKQRRQNNSPGHVITLLDQKVGNLNPDYFSYTVTKLASAANIRFLAQACAPLLRVNAVAPGVTMVSGEMDDQDFAEAHRFAALGRSSQPSDIADAVWSLETMKAVTGQTLMVDGGQHLMPRRRDVAFEED